MNLARLVSLAALASIEGAHGTRLFPEATVRGWIAADLRGFRSRCVVKLGGRTMVDMDELEQWVEDGRGGKVERAAASVTAGATPRRSRRDYADVLREAGLG